MAKSKAEKERHMAKSKAEKEQSLIGKFVLVGTEKQTLAAGILTRYDEERGLATLEQARQIIYWPRESRGAFGVASIGVQTGGRVSPAVPRVELRGVTGIIVATDKARETIEAEPWS